MRLHTEHHLVPNVSSAEGENPELILPLDLSVPLVKNSHLKEKNKKTKTPVSVAVSVTRTQNIVTNLGIKTQAGGFGSRSCRWLAWVGFTPQSGMGGHGQASYYDNFLKSLNFRFREKLQRWYEEFLYPGARFALY